MKDFVITLLFALPCLLTGIGSNAQYTDTSGKAIIVHDSMPTGVIKWNKQGKRFFPYHSFLLPATFIAYGIVSLHTDALQDVNETVKEEIFTERSPHKTTLDNYLQYAPAAVVYALNFAGVRGTNNFRDRTIIYAMANTIMGITVYAGKKITAESRPDGSDKLGFPSGHTATAFAAAEFMRQEYKNVSPWYGIGGYAAAALTGYLRIQNNKHWVGDVIAGAGVGIISTKFAYWIYPVIKRKFFKGKEVTTVVIPSYQNGTLGVGLTHRF